MFKTSFLTLIALCLLIEQAKAQTCSVVGVQVTSQSAIQFRQLSPTSECKEWLYGPINEMKRLKLDFVSASVACYLGDNVLVYNEDRTSVLFDYCKYTTTYGAQNVISAVADIRYVYVRLLTRPNSLLQFIMDFFINNLPTNTVTVSTSIFATNGTTATATTTKSPTFPTLSTTGSTLSTATVTTQTATQTTTTAPIINQQCGVPEFAQSTAGSRIVGGAEANPHSWPWQVKVSDGSYLCGGSLISPDWVLTAAHCVEGVAQNGLIIQLGEHDLSRGESTEQVIRSSQIIIHETYTGSDFDALRGDIALVRLSRPATINAYVKTVCLPSANEDIAPIGSQVYVTGWGKLGQFLSTSSKLFQVGIKVLPSGYCGSGMTSYKICAGDAGQDSCNGDSGGPLQISKSGKYFIAGLVSYGSEKCNQAGVYTKVAAYRDWIRSKTNL